MKEQPSVAGDVVRPNEPIAIVGMACRFPGNVNTLHDYWNLLTQGQDAITEVPETRWSNRRFYDPETSKAGKIKSPKGGFVDRFDQFDAGFFDLFPTVASRIDPQQRFLLETTYEAMEDAGIPLEQLSGSDTAVYMGVFMNDYWDMQAASIQRNQISAHTAMGASRTSVANRISYLYNLKGPSLTVDTACSSSLVGVHMACQSIWSGESRLAVAGGVNIMIRPETSMMLSKGNFLSPDGYCKSFDSRANGYVRSEGCGIVLLKPLAQAEADGDYIYATIRGSAVNQDGYTEAGFTVPSLSSQIAMLNTAYASAGIDPTQVAYVEAHGTGTPVGDPIETNAFGEVLGKGRPADQKCWIGSVKSNIGHTEAAAGVAGLIKLALVLKHQQIPQNLHFENPNPKIPFEEYRLRVPTQLEKLPHTGSPAIGGVNSFGAGGTNAHVVLEEYVPVAHPINRPSEDDQVQLLVISAKSEAALRANAARYVDFLATTKASLVTICHSAATRRSALTHRLAIAARTKEELTEKIEAYVRDETRPGLAYHQHKHSSSPKVGFIFSGQGPQWFAMGQQLLGSSPVFRETILKIDRLFSHVADWSLLEEMSKDEASSRISDTRIAQPAIMAVQIGLTELWKSWGVLAEGCVGHSIGEVAAAYATGALTLEQAVEVIYHRSRGQNRATDKGKMLAAALTLAEAKEAIVGKENRVSIAAINGPNMMTFSGDAEPLEQLAATFNQQDVFHRFLRVNVPFHSHHMEPLKDELIESLDHLVPGRATTALYSTVTGQQEDGRHLDSRYWYRNVREPVYFTDALQQMIDDGFDTFIEIGPHPVLTAGATALLENNKVKEALIVPSLRRPEKNSRLDEATTMTGSLGTLFTQGYPIDGSTLFGQDLPYVKLPAYAWQHQRYWFESQEHAQRRLNKAIHPHISAVTPSATQRHSVVTLALDSETHPYVEDHKVEGTTIFPGTGHLEVADAVGRIFYPDQHRALRDIHFSQAVFVPEKNGGHAVELAGGGWEARVEISEDAEGLAHYALISREGTTDTWTRHSWGTVHAAHQPGVSTNLRLADVQYRLTHPVSVSDFYLELKDSGLQYGEAFRNIRKLWVDQDQQELLSQLTLPPKHQYEAQRFNVHPALLDACLHTIEYAGKWTNVEEKSGTYLPTYIKEYRQFASPGSTVYSYVQVVEAEATHLRGELVIFNEDGTIVAEIKGLECQYIAGSRGEEPRRTYEGMYEYQWEAITDQQDTILIDMQPTKRVNGDATGGCVLFTDDQGITNRLQEYFHRDNLHPIILQKGRAFREIDATHYVVPPESQEAIAEALRRILAHGYRVRRVLYAWGLDQPTDSRLPAEALLASQQHLARMTLNALRSLIELTPLSELCILTQGCEKIIGSDTGINIHQAALYGMGRVTKNEYPGVAVTMVDLSAHSGEEEVHHLYDYFTREDRKQWSHLGLRGSNRYRLQLMPVEDPLAGPAGMPHLHNDAVDTTLTLSPSATYLVTGGASGFGLMLGQWLSERGAKHLALLSRTGTKYAADEQIIAQLRDDGVDVQLFSVDITDEGALRETITRIQATMPSLRGVIHSAAVLHDTTLPNTTPEAYDKVFKPKALGAWNLHLLTQQLPLDFFLTLSSVSAVFGIPGQTSYASANNFLDKLAAHKQLLGQKASSVNLGVLGLYAGMSKGDDQMMRVLENQGWSAMRLEDVLDKIENILLRQPAQRMAASIHWQQFGAFFPHMEADERFASLIEEAKAHGDASGSESLLHQIMSQDEDRRVEAVAEKLTVALGRILGTTAKDIDTTTPVTQLGLDSLMLGQLRNWIQQKLEVNYPLMRIAKGPSLNELAEQLLEQLVPGTEETATEQLSVSSDTSGLASEADIEIIAGEWLVRRKRSEKEGHVVKRLICIHPVGAGASMFNHFIYHAPADTEVMAFQLPGRENRSEEVPYKDMDQLVVAMAEAIQPYLDKPFALIGHSFGGVIGYELLRYLHQTQGVQPEYLTVTGTIAPQLTAGWKRTEAISKTARRSYSEEKIMGVLNYIDDADFLRSILPVMRGDMPLIMSYRYQPRTQVDFPIIAFAAHQDEVVSIEQVGAWKEQTAQGFSLEVVDGDHWFLSRNKERVLERLNEAWTLPTLSSV